MSEQVKPQCIRGCTVPRRHARDCESIDECRGCQPREVHQLDSQLCEACHLRLSASLSEVPGQHALLVASVGPSQQLNMRPQNKHAMPEVSRMGGLRIDAYGDRYRYVKSLHNGSPQEGEPLRVACLDTAQGLADLLAEWIESVCERHNATAPKRAQTAAEREGRKRLVYRPANLYRERETYEWVEPPVRFEVGTAVRWLRNNLGRLEQDQAIGDMMEDLRFLMGQAHALAPWRLPAKRIGGIPCPECHRHTLTQYGGNDTVTCTTAWCKAEIPQGRYLIWAREYEEKAG